ncbi:MAG: DUF3618 domain-containing protein [Chloroflexota bacterium]
MRQNDGQIDNDDNAGISYDAGSMDKAGTLGSDSSGIPGDVNTTNTWGNVDAVADLGAYDTPPGVSKTVYGVVDVNTANAELDTDLANYSGSGTDYQGIGRGETIRDVTPSVSGDESGDTSSEDPEAIRADIEQTRAELTDTINAIQEKLNPQTLMEQAKDTLQDATAGILDNAKETVRDATVGRVEEMVSNATDTAKNTGTNIMDLIKQNPLPAAAVGIGLGWLFTRNKGNSSDNRAMYQPQSYGRQGYANSYGGQAYSDKGYSRAEMMSGETGSDNIIEQVMNGIKNNPVPSAAAGLGLSWLLMNRQNSSGSQSTMHRQPSTYQQYRATYLSDGQPYGEQGGGVGDKVGQVAGQVGDKAGDIADTVGETVGSIAGQVGEKAGDIANSVTQTAGNVAGGTGDMAGNIMRTISENPVPSALAGASIAWLIMKNNSSAQQTMQKATHVVGDVASTTGNKVGDVAGAAGDAVGTVVGAAGDAVGNVAGAAGDAVGNVAGTVKDTTTQAQSQLHRMLLSNPLAVGAMAAAVGAAVGLAIPETPQEHQLMGQARDTLLDKAQNVAQDAMQKVQQVTDEAGRTIQEEARSQGLTQ